jgi:NTE family protein
MRQQHFANRQSVRDWTGLQAKVRLMSQRSLAFGLFIFVILTGIMARLYAATSARADRKIGLVLEGGAALGLAHIGVLQWLEEHRIPISYVAGTSMGGLVGGVYATGNSPAEIRTLVSQIHWDDVLRGEIPFRDLTYRRKQDAEEYPNGLEFGIKDGVRFPEGFNSGYQVGLILDRIALPYSETSSFDDLPTPFACVGTDLVSGKQHVFRSGSLSQALRSTMSLPGIFAPVRANGSIFVDGGLLDNLPVDVAKNMGADIVIAVHLQTKPLEANEPISSFGVMGRSISVVIAANELRSMEMADILISVPLIGYSSTDYNKSAAIIQAGYEAAAKKAAILSGFSLDETDWREYLARREARRKNTPTPQFIEVAGTKPTLAKEIEHKLSNNLGKPIDSSSLEHQLTYLIGGGRYSRLGYRMIERDDQKGLLIVADEKEYGPPLIQPLVVIDGSEYNQVQFLVGARITFLDIGSFGTEWRNDVTLGSEHSLKSEFYHPLGQELHWFVAPRVFASNSAEDFYTENTLIAEYRNRLAGGNLDTGYLFNRNTELRIGYEAGDQDFYPSVGAAKFGTLHGRIGTTSVRYNHVGRDHPIIPSKGFDLHLRAEWHDANPGAKSAFPLAETQFVAFKPLNLNSSAFFSGAGGTTFNYHQTGFPPFSLGGSQYLAAYGNNEFLTNQYFLFKTGYIRKLWGLPPLLGDKVYAVGTYEIAKVYDLPNVSSLPTDVAGAIVVNTIFGPVTVGGTYGATGHYKFFYRVGRIF